jgi:hypothetical protein
MRVCSTYDRFLKVLLLTWSTAEAVFAVDPWQHFADDAHYEDLANKGQQEQETLLLDTIRRVSPLGNAYLVRDKSPDVAEQFPDEFFDFVYLDARHDYTNVLTDLAVFWPKMKPQGILAGHDFRDTAVLYSGQNDWIVQPDGSRHPEGKAVKGAVMDFAALVNRQVTVCCAAML